MRVFSMSLITADSTRPAHRLDRGHGGESNQQQGEHEGLLHTFIFTKALAGLETGPT